MEQQQYNVTKQFIGGLLDGMTIVERTTVKFKVGFVCAKPCGGSPYKVIAVEAV